MTDLLKVLDMSEDEQRAEIAKLLSIAPFKHDWGFSNAVGGSDNIATGEAWICRKCGHEEIYNRIKSGQYIPAVLDKQSLECGLPDPIQDSLADLAFRLRDEVIAKDDESEIDCNWCEASYEVYLYVIGEENEMEAKEGLDTWFTMRAKPIHWIIAALIAKEKGKENDL